MKQIKQILIVICLLMLVGGANATYEQINDTLYIYNGTTVHFTMIEGLDTNVENVVCTGGICTAMQVSIASTKDYDIEYELHYAPNESIYYSSIIRVKQEETSSYAWGLYKTIERTLYIDGVEIATYNNSLVINTGSRNTFAFNAMDKTILFGTQTVQNTTLFFSELILTDQQEQLANETGYVGIRFVTSGEYDTEYRKLEMGGFTGMFLSVVKCIPIIGDNLYSVLSPIMLLIQYTFDFGFTFLNLIINDWWYALLLLECICLYKASRERNYVNVVSIYIQTHVVIVMFIYHKVVIPLIDLAMNVLSSIKDMIKWWNISLFSLVIFMHYLNNCSGVIQIIS